MRFRMHAVAFAAATLAIGQGAWAGEAEAKKWIDSEFQPSTLTKEQQTAEMKWFIDSAKKLQAKGVKEISVVSETITTHEYESKTLAKAFEEITGIKVKHDIIQEGDVVEKLQTSMQSGKSIYDGWISDSDLIGTHYRYGKILALSDYMAGSGKEWTNPGTGVKSTDKLYDGTVFHRVIGGFMIQGGDPLGTGRGGPGYTFDDEIHPELSFNEPYLLAMANAGKRLDPTTGKVGGTNGSQFFISVAPTEWLNGKHTIFGKVADDESRAVVDAIESTKVRPGDRPVEDIVINSITIED